MAEIYALTCPDTSEVRYIGKADNSRKRFAKHLADARRRNTPVYCWIRKLNAEGKVPGMHVLEVTDDWVSAEKKHIAEGRMNGLRLLNLADGGDQPKTSIEQQMANGHALSRRLEVDVELAFRQYVRKRLCSALRNGHLSENAKSMMRKLAALEPKNYGDWACV